MILLGFYINQIDMIQEASEESDFVRGFLYLLRDDSHVFQFFVYGSDVEECLCVLGFRSPILSGPPSCSHSNLAG
jgi:hypothetical protein